MIDENATRASSALEWARSGAMALTGSPLGPPLASPAGLAVRLTRALDALVASAGESGAALAGIDAPALLGERAACLGLRRGGRVSAGGSCRFLRVADGWLALNLARPDDALLLPAWLEQTRADAGPQPPASDGPWQAAQAGARHRRCADLVARGRLMGLPVAPVAEPPARAPAWHRVHRLGVPKPRSCATRPLVIDLTSLWAGPLCGELLQRAGARVVKVECETRPDGARHGSARFFDLLNAGKQSVALDFTSLAGRRALHRLVERADIVLESARPRALEQLGIRAETWTAAQPGRTWLSLTGYGRDGERGRWVAFGDDAAAAAGLAQATAPGLDTPVFCADAIADPLAGVHAALAAHTAWRAGGGRLIEIALADVAAHCLATAPDPGPVRVERAGTHAPDDTDRWRVVASGGCQDVLAPRARVPRQAARALGADTPAVLQELATPC